jgi:hypothetical protein
VTPANRDKATEEFVIFAQRFMHFMNLYTVYRDMLSGHYVPTLNPPSNEPATFPRTNETVMLLLYAYLYSLIEQDDQSLNAFRIWRARFPEEENAIAAVEAEVTPFAEHLKRFRNRLAFHGSTSMAHEASGYDLFANFSGMQILTAIKNFKSLGATLFAKDVERQNAAAGS